MKPIVPRSAIVEKVLTDSFEVIGATLTALYGLFLLITWHVPPSLQVFAPGLIVIMWAILLVAGGVLTLYGMFKDLTIEVAGLVMLSASALAYAVVIPLHSGPSGLAAASWPAAYGVASAIRAVMIRISLSISQEIYSDDH